MKEKTRREQIAKRLKAASKGPWIHIMDDPMFMGVADVVDGPAIEVRGRVYRQFSNNYNPQVAADAVFIAHAPTDIAWLLKQLDRGHTKKKEKNGRNGAP